MTSVNSDLVMTCQHLVTSQEEQVFELVFRQPVLLIELFLLQLPDGSLTRCQQQLSRQRQRQQQQQQRSRQ